MGTDTSTAVPHGGKTVARRGNGGAVSGAHGHTARPWLDDGPSPRWAIMAVLCPGSMLVSTLAPCATMAATYERSLDMTRIPRPRWLSLGDRVCSHSCE